MPRGRKNTELPLATNNSSQLYEVQKSTPLFSLWKSELSLFEFKVLDTYLARINSRNPEQRCVRFEKGEMERFLGVTQLKPNDLKLRLRHLMGQVVEIKDSRKNNGFTLITLFSKALCEKDENGQWQIDLSCTPEAMEYFFNVEEIGYFRYKLRSIVNITSRYSYILFTYLENNRFRKEWNISLSELKQILSCENDESYSEFKIFNNRILKKCHEELNEKTECKYSYEPIRKNRKVVAIKFKIKSLDKVITQTSQEKQQDFKAIEIPTPEPDENCLYFASALDYTFSDAELKEIVALIDKIYPDYDNKQKYNCLRCSWYKLLRYAETKTINNKLQYLKTIINNDFAELPKREEKEQKKSKGEEIAKKYEIFTKMI